MLQLRDYQDATLEALRKGFAEGHRTQVLYAPTGAGKTEMAIALLDATKKKLNKAAMVLDRIVLCNQTSTRLDKYKIDHGVMQSGHWRFRPYERIQVCSAQTLERRQSMPDLQLLIVDECFPAGTNISTPTGLKDISLVRCGDTVYNATGVGVVMGVMAKPAFELIKLEFEDGTFIECTRNHPIFTESGWITAEQMEVGRVSYSIQGLHLLWESFYTDHKNGREQDRCFKFNQTLGSTKSLLKILLKEVEKSNEQHGITIQDEGNAKENWSSTNSQGGEWQIASSAADCFASCLGQWMASGISCSNKDATSENWISNLLQAGHCKLGDENWDRVGRFISQLNREESARFEKDRLLCFPRVVGISHIKSESSRTVFNLHISGHPSYFANEKLVHNCHQTRDQTVQFIKNNPNIKVIGLSATPFTKGLGKIYENVISTVTTKNLVDQKVLVPLRVYIAKEIDMEGAKKVAGEWSQSESTTRGMKITGDIVAEWIKKTHEIFGEPKKTVVFCAGVEHGNDLARKFAEQGYNFVSISYRDKDEFKEDVIKDFSRPHTEIHGLIATDILTKGFDCSDVMIGISARPFSKSLSSHIQQMGRVMRGHEEKEFALWLDHSGNYLRFREDWEDIYANGVHSLDDGKEKTRKEPTKAEKEASKCPKCGALWTGGDTCHRCGHVKEKRNQVSSVAGELQELSGTMGTTSKQEFWYMMQYYKRYHGWSDGRMAHTYRDKFGVWPRGLDTSRAIEPNQEVKKFVDKKLRSYITMIKKGGLKR